MESTMFKRKYVYYCNHCGAWWVAWKSKFAIYEGLFSRCPHCKKNTYPNNA